jgi:hypothetical protein
VKLQFFDYRYASAVLDHPAFGAAKQEITDILTSTPVPLLDPTILGGGGVKRRKRDARRGDAAARYFFLPVDQKALNSALDRAFKAKDWQLQPRIVTANMVGPKTGLKGDYKKGRLQVEIQFGNMARWYTDVFKFQLSYSLDQIDAAVLVVPTQRLANLIDENIAYYERVLRELPWAKMSLTLPIWVIGVEPNDYTPIRKCYDTAAKTWSDRNGGKTVTIPFDERIVEEPGEEEAEAE